MPSATTVDTAREPHINGGESSLDGSVPDLRNRYFSFNLLYIAIELCYLVHVKLKQTQKVRQNKYRNKILAELKLVCLKKLPM